MPDRIAEIRARLDAATPGPWEYDHVSRSVIGEPKWSDTSREVVRSAGHFNGEFIAHAPADIAWLLNEVAAMTERAAYWEREARHHRGDA